MIRKMEVQALIPRYRVCWSSYPEKQVVDGAVREIGFRVELYGTHPCETRSAAPGYLRSYEVWTALKELAQWILPATGNSADCEIEAFDNSIHYSGTRRNRADVELHIRIIHRSGFGPVDESETYCLDQITARLLELGASKDYYWKRTG